LTRDLAAVQAVREAVIEHGLQGRVHLHGEVDDAALERWYANAEVVVMPSHFEGYGMVLAEALAHGVPVVATATGAAVAMVGAEAGVLVPPGDSAALRRAIAWLIAEPALRSRLAAGACAARARLPTWPAACERFAAVLGAAMAESRA
jgi:glycosyltransferase involved in cell wall biosynthesis